MNPNLLPPIQLARRGSTVPVPLPEVPVYCPSSFGRWRLVRQRGAVMPGYFFGLSPVASYHALQQRPKLGRKWTTWMSVTPMELESHMLACDAAHGDVVIAGLGMGLALFNIAAKPDVTRVTVLEKDPQVIELFGRFADTKVWPGFEKVEIVLADALEWVPLKAPDFLYADVWDKVASRAALPYTRRMVALQRPGSVYFWTQEFDFITYVASAHRSSPFTPDYFPEFARAMDMPLVGSEYSGYALLALEAVRVYAAGISATAA